MSEHNHTGLDEAVSVASNTLQAVRTGKAISAAAKGAAAGGPYGAAIGAALSARTHIGKAVAAALGLLALPLLFILLLPSVRSSRAADPQQQRGHYGKYESGCLCDQSDPRRRY